MSEALVARYWCHMCSQMVSPILEVELKCPYCDGGFVEEMEGRGGDLDSAAGDLGSDRALSLWAPILLGMMGGPSRRRQFRTGSEDENPDQEDRDIASVLRRRRRSTAIMQLLQTLQDGIQSDSNNSESVRDRERVILINPYNQAVILGTSNNTGGVGGGASLGDYYVGPGLDALLQHLAESDPNRYGTPPARKEVVEALPTVKVEGGMSCSVCLEDFDIGSAAREMPCKHKFHSGCIMPWLELHSSCPVCRFQLPADESKDSGGGGGGGSRAESGGGEGGDGDGGRRFWVPVPWPFNGLFSFSGNQSGGSSSTAPPGSGDHGNQN